MNLSRQICLIVCCLIVLVPRFNFSETNNVGKSLWSDLIEATQQWSRTQAQQLGQDFQQLARNANISMECNASVVQTLEAFSRLEDWAHKSMLFLSLKLFNIYIRSWKWVRNMWYS